MIEIKKRDIYMNGIEDVRKSTADQVKRICAQYGLYGNAIYYSPSPFEGSDLNKMYIIAGFDPALSHTPPPKYLCPDEIVRRIEQNENLFYPNIWAFDMSSCKNEMDANHALVEYCKNAEFISNLYKEYDLSAPTKLRVSEVGQLINFRTGLDNPLANSKLISRYKRGLDWFFKREKSKNVFRQKWLDYFRSEKFPDDKGPIAKLVGYFRRDSNIYPIEQLMNANGDIRKLEMQEHEYKWFAKFLKENHPDVCISVGEKKVVNHGSVRLSDDSANPFGRCVTGEEYAVIRKERFAEEGWEAVKDLRMTYWEFRDVFYKAVDEPIIAGVYNDIVLSYAKCDSLMKLKERGPIKMKKIPANDFMNFVGLAKHNSLHFYIDNSGDYAVPSLESITVLYNEYQEDKMNGILNRMVNDKINYSHMVEEVIHPTLSSKINDVTLSSGMNNRSRNHINTYNNER